MTIRKADKEKDYDSIWEIFSNVIKTADTYVFGPDTPKESLAKIWFADNMDTFVAVEDDGSIVGTYFIKPNQVDLGSHIANCGYMVSPMHQGRGVGQQMCEHSIEWARAKGYTGIQFNIVVSSNISAVNLWKRYGFEIIGTTPKGFRHKDLGFVDTYIMFKNL